MAENENAFPLGVAEHLQTYVYRLIDPRDGETFYVGRGKDNRVFCHVRDELKSEDLDEKDYKLQRIRDIHGAGLKVQHIIHRHGLNEEVAAEVEAALIDAYPGLTNIAGGAGQSGRGVMHAQEIITLYAAQTAVFKHKALLINVNHSANIRELYDAVRYAWKINLDRAEKMELVLAVQKGIIKGAFIADKWLPATPENFPKFIDRPTSPGRNAFEGHEAPDEIWNLYVGKRIPDEYRKQGAAYPIKYAEPTPR